MNGALHGGECIVSGSMSLDALRLFEHVHGHLGWLAAALLVHPAIVLGNTKRRAHLAVGLSTGAVTVGAALGAWLYVAYRERLKQQIFIQAPTIGWLFFAAMLVMGWWWQGWYVWAALIAFLIRIRHPPVLVPNLELDPARKAAGWLAVAAFVLCFTPVPFDL